MKAVIYARYSSDNQREESIDGQLRECMEYAKFNGIDVVNSYIDRALSAKTDNRPNFQRMIKDSYKGLFDVVLVWKLDRFARCFRYGESFEIRRLQNVLHTSPALPKFVTFFKNRAAMTSAQGLRAPQRFTRCFRRRQAFARRTFSISCRFSLLSFPPKRPSAAKKRSDEKANNSCL